MVDGFHHVLEHLVQERGGVLGAMLSKERHRGEDVGKEHRHLLLLSRDRLAGDLNPLGQMGEGVVIGSADVRGLSLRRAPESARRAEARFSWNRVATAFAKYNAGAVDLRLHSQTPRRAVAS